MIHITRKATSAFLVLGFKSKKKTDVIHTIAAMIEIVAESLTLIAVNS
jgi:hypothetical protein